MIVRTAVEGGRGRWWSLCSREEVHGRGEQGGVRRSPADSHGSRGRGGLRRGVALKIAWWRGRRAVAAKLSREEGGGSCHAGELIFGKRDNGTSHNVLTPPTFRALTHAAVMLFSL